MDTYIHAWTYEKQNSWIQKHKPLPNTLEQKATKLCEEQLVLRRPVEWRDLQGFSPPTLFQGELHLENISDKSKTNSDSFWHLHDLMGSSTNEQNVIHSIRWLLATNLIYSLLTKFLSKKINLTKAESAWIWILQCECMKIFEALRTWKSSPRHQIPSLTCRKAATGVMVFMLCEKSGAACWVADFFSWHIASNNIIFGHLSMKTRIAQGREIEITIWSHLIRIEQALVPQLKSDHCQSVLHFQNHTSKFIRLINQKNQPGKMWQYADSYNDAQLWQSQANKQPAQLAFLVLTHELFPHLAFIWFWAWTF